MNTNDINAGIGCTTPDPLQRNWNLVSDTNPKDLTGRHAMKIWPRRLFEDTFIALAALFLFFFYASDAIAAGDNASHHADGSEVYEITDTLPGALIDPSTATHTVF
jgi:hypothetical protein